MADRRVAITGLGVVTPAGIGIQPLWDALMASRQAVKTITLFDAGKFPCSIGGQLDDFSARNYVPKDYRKAVKVMARDIEIAVAAADLAFRDSGITTKGIDPAKTDVDSTRLGCNIGAGLICSDLDELGAAVSTSVKDGKFDLKLWGASGLTNLTPLWLLKYLPNMLSCHVTIIHGAEGPSNTITCGDASGLLAASEASRLIERNGADVVIAGGAETKLNPMGLLRQSMLQRICTTKNDSGATALRPFDAGHCGTVIGEGGGLLVLEEMNRASQRGARIYAELAGFGAACDPSGIDVLKPNAGSLDLAVKNALRDAKISPDQVGLIVAHGTGVPGEDECETKAWRSALGDAAGKIPAVAITGATGWLSAGTGAVSISVAAMAMKNQTVPPTINFNAPAFSNGLNLSSQARAAKIDYAVCGAFTVGGQSGACVLKRCTA
jgi:3-oxoacyl-[acyl-carrier-protein] synthase II